MWLLLLLPILAATPVSSQNEISSGNYLRPCYFTNWAQYRQGRGKYMPEDYIPGLCTHILFAFGWMNEDYTVRAYDPADLPNDWAGDGMFKRVNALKKKDPGLKTLLSIGGWSFGTRLFKEMSQTSERRKKFIDSAVAFVRQWDLDGIDIDWEYPEAVDMQNYVATMTELRAAVEAEASSPGRSRLLITAAVAAAEEKIEAGYNVAALASAYDFLLLMSYDFHGAWSDRLGANSPLYSRVEEPQVEKVWNIDWAANHWHSKGMPKEKIVIGMPTYGRGWTLKDQSQITPGSSGNSPARATQYVREAGIASYYEICEMLSAGAHYYWDAEQKVPYLVNGDQWFSYDNVQSYKEKLAYIRRNGFGGAFVWTLDFDDFNAKCPGSDQPYPLISTIAEELGGGVTHAPPAPPAPTTPAPAPSEKPTSAPTAAPTPAPVSTTKGQGYTCSQDGFFVDPTNCAKFIRCVNGIAYHFDCPPGTSWNKYINACDFWNPANC